MIERYIIPEMVNIWSRESRYSRWLRIELLAVEARVLSGDVPRKDYEKIKKQAAFEPDKIDEIEKTVRHDVIAFLTNVSEHLGKESRHLHYGMTSSDILDTALAMQIKDAGELLVLDLDNYGKALRHLIEKTRGIACIGRTHGMFAEPTTMAIKFAGFYTEYVRNRKRLTTAIQHASVGKLSGAVGTYAHLPPEVEQYVCEKLGIIHEDVATQIIPRDRHAEFIWALASVTNGLERFALEIRHLQRSEVGEVEESFTVGQKGSSAMPHKRNPIISERLSGIARLLRGYLTTAMENTILWHERDISHSSAERLILPDACGITLYALRKAAVLAKELRIYPEKIKTNLKNAGDSFFSQSILLALIDRGKTREEAYALVQKSAMKALKSSKSLPEILKNSSDILQIISSEEIDEVCEMGKLLKQEAIILKRTGISQV